jgi:hypothetical protein
MNTIEQIVKAKFLATEAQVQSLAAVVAQGSTATGIYLGVVVAHTQELLADKKRVTPKVAESVIDEVHKRFYPCALAGVGPADLAADERNRLATFARSAVSDLRFYAREGGDVRTLNPATVKKGELRPSTVPAGTRIERGIATSIGRFERIVQRLAKTSPDEARKQIEEAQAKLEALLASLDKPAKGAHRRPRKSAVRVVSTRLQRTRHEGERPAAH